MAKALKAVDAELTTEGVRFVFERLGERFSWTASDAALEGLVQVAMRALAARGAGIRRSVEGLAFSSDPGEAGAPPVLRLDLDDGIIALDLTWSQVTAMSRLAEGMLQHAPTPDRPT